MCIIYHRDGEDSLINIHNARFESFGGIVSLDRPAVTAYLDRSAMRSLGYTASPLWEQDSGHLSAPLTAHFAVTRQCPLGCRMCYNNSGKSTQPELSTAEIKRVLDELARMQVFTVAFGGGEPLSRPDIFELAQYTRQAGMIPTMTTNGYYVDPQIAHQCRVFDHIHVSLDGIGEHYRTARGVDAFQHADRAIHLLRRERIPVGVNCIVSRLNFDHLEELTRYLRQVGIRDVIFLRLKPQGRASSDYSQSRLTPEQAWNFYPRLVELARHYHLQAHVDCAMMPFLYAHQPDLKRLQVSCGEGCRGANEIIEISADGLAHACSFAVGSAGDAWYLSQAWHTAPHLARFRQLREYAAEPCLTCSYFDLCRGGCHALTEALTGDFFAPDPECPFVEGG